MKRKVIIFALGLMCALTFSGCGNEDNTSNSAENNSVIDDVTNTKDNAKESSDTNDANENIGPSKENNDVIPII